MWSWGMCVYEPCNKKRKLTIIITQGGRRWWIKLAPTISVKVGTWAAAASTSRLSESMVCTCVQSLLVGAAFLVKPGQPWVLFQLFAFFSSRHIFFRTLFGRKDNSKTVFVFKYALCLGRASFVGNPNWRRYIFVFGDCEMWTTYVYLYL